MRLFTSSSKSAISVDWHTQLTDTLQKQITQIHVAAFLDLYANLTEEYLEISNGRSKAEWLNDIITDELKEFMKGGLYLATVSLENHVVGFAFCSSVKARHIDFKNDVSIDLLAVKPFRYFQEPYHKIRIGLGRRLIESVEAKFELANTITLDTRLKYNEGAIAFYKKMGFIGTPNQSFGGYDTDYFQGYEKKILRQL